MNNFEGFGLSESLNKSLAKINYTTPTPIQQKAIPLALEGRDILGSAQTGTGKTAAFAIPLVEKLLRSPQGTALVLTPTRELAKQVLDVIHQLLGHQNQLKTAFIIGGESMAKQYQQLRQNPRIIVGTPGRINDHLERGNKMLAHTEFLVLDETDRMLDMGFGIQLDQILKYLPKQRQTLMFSATLSDSIIKISSKYLNNPERVSMGATNVVAVKIKQDIIKIEQDKKYAELLNQLAERTGSVIIFIKTKHGADRMAKNLNRDGHEADALHGDLRQNKRDQVMKNFRNQRFRILVATDIAARGLDVPHIEHVVNYDMPQVAEDYIHRMGRTARAGAEGSAVCFIASHDVRKWRAIEQLLTPGSKPSEAGNGFVKENRKQPGKHRSKPSHGERPNRGERPDYAKGKNRGKPFGKPKFEKRFEGGKPFKKFRDERSGEGQSSERTQSEGFKKHGKPFAKKRDYNDGQKFEKRQDRSDKPFAKKREYNDGPKFEKRQDRSDKPFAKKRDFGDKPKFEKRQDRGDKPFNKFRSNEGGAKFEKREDGGFKKPFKKPDGKYRDQKPGGNPNGDQRSDKPFKKDFGGAKKSYGKKPERSEGGGYNPNKKFGGKPQGNKPRTQGGYKDGGFKSPKRKTA